ncbi:MAG: Gfo/Idh/MocA family oxidoreductase [Oligoflexia bacterium]|nr:Gfo/Idh/MocA family oxidoreductase [Oligoflexia bacterium]
MNKLRAAVIGVGYLGRFHAQKYKLLEDVELVAVCDSKPERGNQVAQELGVPYEPDYKKLKGRIDLATVAASTTSHFEITQWLVENGIHAFIEKPMTVTSAQAEVLVELARKHQVLLQVGHVERFNPAMISSQKVLKNPLFIEVHRLAPFTPRGADVDVVLDLMIHDLDVILTLVNSELKSVSAVGVPVLTPLVDIANARLEFKSGTIVNVTASRVSLNTTRKFRVFERDKYLSIDFGKGSVDLMEKTGDWSGGIPPIKHESWSLEKGDALLQETRSFVDCVRNKTKPIVSGEDGLRALQLAERILEDIRGRIRDLN